MGVGGDDYLQWNVRGISDKLRRKAKIQKIENILENASKIKILNLQETHLMSEEDEPPSFKKLKHIFHIVHSFAPLTDRGAGICIFVNKTENIMIQEVLLEGRLIYLKLENKAFLSHLYKFAGKYETRGLIVNSVLVPIKYDQVWLTKKKNTRVEMIFNND